MKKWSRYNYILDSEKNGKFIYNSRTNSFTKINDVLFDIVKDNKRDISLLSESIGKKFEDLKILVDENEDDDYYYNKKYLKYVKSSSNNRLGLTIATTTNCNFRCPYCYEEAEKKINSDKKVWDAIIGLIAWNPAKYVDINWYGGEPLMNFKAIEYITNILGNEYNGKMINYSIITNGYLLTPKIVEMFAECKLASMQITLDGLKETNDKSRILANGKGSFDKIMDNLTYAIDKLPNCRFALRVNVGKSNIGEFPVLRKFLYEKFKGEKNLQVYHSFIRDYSETDMNCITTDEQIDYNEELLEKHGIADRNFYPSFNLGGCVADSLNGYLINPDGTTCRCFVDVGKPDRVTGTIMNDSSVKINKALLARYITNSDLFSKEKCKECFLVPICSGGCSYQNLTHPERDDCTIKPKNIGKHLEMYYEHLQRHKQKQNA